jgi:hypothetical protein
MKKLLLSFTLILLVASANAEVIPASDTRLTFVGRTHLQGTSVAFDWTGVYCRIAFSGKNLTMRATDIKPDTDPAAAAKKHTYFNIWIDAPMSDEPHRIIGRSIKQQRCCGIYCERGSNYDHQVSLSCYFCCLIKHWHRLAKEYDVWSQQRTIWVSLIEFLFPAVD